MECDEINMDLTFNSTYSFNVPGRITNLTMERYEDNIKFSYSSDGVIYEYVIYPPTCNNIEFSFNELGSYQFNLNSLFNRKTSTNYYIIEENIPPQEYNIIQMKLNGETLDQSFRGKKILIENKENIISLISIQRIEKEKSSDESKIYHKNFDIITG